MAWNKAKRDKANKTRLRNKRLKAAGKPVPMSEYARRKGAAEIHNGVFNESVPLDNPMFDLPETKKSKANEKRRKTMEKKSKRATLDNRAVALRLLAVVERLL